MLAWNSDVSARWTFRKTFALEPPADAGLAKDMAALELDERSRVFVEVVQTDGANAEVGEGICQCTVDGRGER